jgi:hypothetical protein
MGGTAGVDLAKIFKRKGLDFTEPAGELTLWEANPTYSTLEHILRSAPDGTAVIQVGSSSGREIAWVADEFPHVRCVGSDIVPEVVEYSRTIYDLPNLEFVVVSAKEMAEYARSLGEGPVVVFASGSMQYVQPEHLHDFFAGLASLPSVEVVFTESASLVRGNPMEIEWSKPREWFDYTHNYRRYAEKHGFETVEARLVRPYDADDPVHGSVVHYFFWGRSGRPVGSGQPMEGVSRPAPE